MNTEKLKLKMKNLVLHKGIWCVRKMKDGKRKLISTGFRDPVLAERRAHEIIKDINDEKQGWKRTVVPDFDVAAKRHLDVNSGTDPKKKQRDGNFLARAILLWKGRKLTDIDEDDCKQYLTWRRGGPRPGEAARRKEDGRAGAKNSIHTEVVLICAVFNAALRKGVIKTDPWASVDNLKGDPRSRVVSLDEQALTASQLTEEYQRLQTCYIGTGLRANELHKLEEDDINFDKNRVELPAHKAKGKKHGRNIPMKPEVRDAFKTQIALRKTGDESKLRKPGGGSKRKHATAIFNMGRESALATIQKAARDGGVKQSFTLHDYRRTFGTRCAEGGMHIKQLSMIMGHSDIMVTAKYYIHIGDDNLDAAMQAVDLGLSPAMPTDKVLNFERR